MGVDIVESIVAMQPSPLLFLFELLVKSHLDVIEDLLDVTDCVFLSFLDEIVDFPFVLVHAVKQVFLV